MFRRRHEERTMTGLAAESAEGGFQRGKIFVAIELSKAKWVVALRVPHLDKVSLFEIAGGDAERLLGLLDRARATIPGACGGSDQSTVSSACTERPGCLATQSTKKVPLDQDAGREDQHAALASPDRLRAAATASA
jgi:hypothetical protein